MVQDIQDYASLIFCTHCPQLVCQPDGEKSLMTDRRTDILRQHSQRYAYRPYASSGKMVKIRRHSRSHSVLRFTRNTVGPRC